MSGNYDSLHSGSNAVRDDLTSTFSRGYFVTALETEREVALESGKPFVVCLIDVDQLRTVNEQFGQRVGDTVLVAVAELVRSTLDLPQWQNLPCLMARYDGDGLVLLLPGCRLQRGEQFAHVVNRRVADSVFAGGVRVTVTIAATAFASGDSVDSLLARVEKTMYVAKQFGLDSVEIARTPEFRPAKATITRLPVAWHGAGKPGGRAR
jgi:diguanylate cyclase (GGDEF)-like protein